MQVLIVNQFGLKILIHSPIMEVFGGFDLEIGSTLITTSKGTSLHRNTSYSV